MSLKLPIDTLLAGRDLGEAGMIEAMSAIMTGQATAAQIGGFLVALRAKGETASEIAGAAHVMRQHVARVQHGFDHVLDTCGTGGDGAGTFNISTTVAFVAAGAGATVAKHGNRAISSRSGSADVLEALGVRIDLPLEATTACLKEVGFAFLFAPSHHPAMRYVASARRELGVRTVMNLLGPLTNPAGATHQLVGIYDGNRVAAVAETLGRLGARRAVVVHGDGLDEVNPAGPTQVAIWSDGALQTSIVSPADVGLEPIDLADIAGGDSAENAIILRDVLSGKLGPHRIATVLNAAFALFAAELVDTPQAGLAMAEKSIDSGAAAAVLDRLIEFTNR
ncbi:MAG: anthranilate phosphoribosyltransferase [Myxococcota bacterium]|jgi:anthranilate phosphoribosyltransferase